MSEPPAREWRFYLDDMVGFAEKVAVYTEGLDPAGSLPADSTTTPRYATWS
jgi:uncharacterized protein with HEPN domain